MRIHSLSQEGKFMIIPMDHGTTLGPIKGLTDINWMVREVDLGGATAVLLHKGMMKLLQQVPSCGMIMHGSASTSLSPNPNSKVLVADVLEAVRLGAAAFSIHVNLGSKNDKEMLIDLGNVSQTCENYQIPLLAMIYIRSPKISVVTPKMLAHAARLGAELGADIIKVSYTGDPDTFSQVVEGCPVPVIIAGGPKYESDLELLTMVEGAMKAGAAGVALGRNVFQHPNPRAMVAAVRQIVINQTPASKAITKLL
ncbi:MAG: 2-amino-3,7-dideoxy-D-threo-hept-6-ulosonate synthase [Promethearchaeota archaeon]